MALNTLQRIDSLVGRINTHPEYSKCVSRDFRNMLRDESVRHSVEIERRAKKDYNEEGVDGEETALEGLSKAWHYLQENGIDFYVMGRLGNLIDPVANPNCLFRRGSELAIGDFTPPKAHELPEQLKNLSDFLETTSLHPVERAAVAHSELVRIHPYGDGNGRAARLLQNFCLEQRGLPSAVIPASERDHYISLMGKVLDSRFGNETSILKLGDADSLFNGYIATKVLNALESLDNELSAKRIYDVHIDQRVDQRPVHILAENIRGIGRRPGNMGVTVKLDKSNHGKRGKSLRVVGDVSLQELTETVGSIAEKYGIHKYGIDVGCKPR